jgi:hypothetical protein
MILRLLRKIIEFLQNKIHLRIKAEILNLNCFGYFGNVRKMTLFTLNFYQFRSNKYLKFVDFCLSKPFSVSDGTILECVLGLRTFDVPVRSQDLNFANRTLVRHFSDC